MAMKQPEFFRYLDRIRKAGRDETADAMFAKYMELLEKGKTEEDAITEAIAAVKTDDTGLGQRLFVAKIIGPDPANPPNIVLKKEASTGKIYHDKLIFDCEVTGGVPPFQYKWEVEKNGRWVHFWPYDAATGDAIKNPARIPAIDARDYRFFKGGFDVKRNNFHFIEPFDPDHMEDQFASLEPGKYKIRVLVRDKTGKVIGMNPNDQVVTTFTVGGLIPDKQYLKIAITNPATSGNWKEVKLNTDMSTGEQWHDALTFDCSVTHGVTPYTYKWEIDGTVVWEGTGDRFKKFMRGGADNPVAGLDIPFAGLAEGRHEVKLTVTDNAGNNAAAKIGIIVVLEERGKIRVIITSPLPKEGEDAAVYDVKKESTSDYKYHDPIKFDCEVSGGAGNYEYQWTAQSLDDASFAPTSDVIPLTFVSRKNFTRGGPTHPIENQDDPQASLQEGLYKITVKVTNVKSGETAEASTWLRIGEITERMERSRASYLGMRPGVRVGGGLMGPYAPSPTGRGGYLRREAITGFKERARYRMQNPSAGLGRGFSVGRYGKGMKKGVDDASKETSVSENPAVQAAVNDAKRDLNRWSRSMTSHLFAKRKKELDKYIKSWEERRKEWMDVRQKVRSRIGAAAGIFNAIRSFAKGQGPADALLIGIEKQLGDSDEAKMLNDEVNRTYNAFTKAEEDLLNFSHQAQIDLAKDIGEKLDNMADPIAKRAAYKYKVVDALDVVKAELDIEKEKLKDYLIATGKDRLSGPAGLLRSASLSVKTMGSSYYAFIEFIKTMLTGPWIWGTLFVILQFFFVLTYVGYNLTYLWIFPFIAAAFAFLLNFSDTMRPLDWISHLISGAMIGYSALLFMLAFYLPRLSFYQGSYGTLLFWLTWGFLGTVGLFQFYQTGGFRTVFIGSVFIILFAYFALGPYSGYYQAALDQVSQPLEIAYRAVSGAVQDVWLLATNPTEWYARQQLVNVRPERTLAFAKAIEFTVDAIPSSVPGGQEFAITSIIKNEGTQDAKDIKMDFRCIQWCDTKFASVVGSVEDKISGKYPVSTPRKDAVTGVNLLQRGEATTATIQNLVAHFEAGREVEFRIAKVRINIGYEHTTSSTLEVDITSNEELSRRFSEGEDVFRNKVAVAKVTPAQISLNVGPQPLRAGSKAILLVSVSNQRDDTTIILEKGDEIIVTVPRLITENIRCGTPEEYDIVRDAEKNTIIYKLPKRVEILEYDFQSIFAFSCEFDVSASPVTTRSGLVTATLPRYVVQSLKEKNVPITPPIGILADPQAKICARCGTDDGECDPDDCYALSKDPSDPALTCWYNSAAEDIPFVPVDGFASCHSCGPISIRDCGQFRSQEDCASQSTRCGMNCEWATKEQLESEGAHITDRILAERGTCRGIPSKAVDTVYSNICGLLRQEHVDGYNKYSSVIRFAVSRYGLDALVKGTSYDVAEALVASLITHESAGTWNERVLSPCAAGGLMQLIPDTARARGLDVPAYSKEGVCNLPLCKIKVSVCNSCTPTKCDFTNDERFDGRKAIDAGVGYLVANIRKCDNGDGVITDGELRDGLAAYNSGRCGVEANPGFLNGILVTQYGRWVSCYSAVSEIERIKGLFGAGSFCQERIALGPPAVHIWPTSACDLGEGGCQSDAECVSKSKPGGAIIECRDPGIEVRLCCWQPSAGQTLDQVNQECIDAFNARRNPV